MCAILSIRKIYLYCEKRLCDWIFLLNLDAVLVKNNGASQAEIHSILSSVLRYAPDKVDQKDGGRRVSKD